MLVRGPMMRRGPGLIGTVARTAVIAGTATAVSGGMQRRRAEQAEQAAEAQQYQAMNEQQAVQQAAPATPPASNGASTDNVINQLERLAALHTSGVLTDAEFADQKAKILGT
jgi:hypothetical protein